MPKPGTERSRYDVLVERQAGAIAAGYCGCLCGQPLEVKRRRGVRYRDKRHSQRAYRARIDARAADRGVLTKHGVMTLESLCPASDTGSRNGDAPTARKRPQRRRQPELRVSYRKAVDHLAHWLMAGGEPPAMARCHAEQVIGAVLTPRQRDALARMRARDEAGT